MLVISLVFITIFLWTVMRGSELTRHRHHPAPAPDDGRQGQAAPHRRAGRAHVFVGRPPWPGCSRWCGRSNSFRDYASPRSTAMSFGGFTFQNYLNAWEQGDFTRHFLNSLIITVPAVLLTLFLASCVAFVVARSWHNLVWGCSPRPTCCPSRPC